MGAADAHGDQPVAHRAVGSSPPTSPSTPMASSSTCSAQAGAFPQPSREGAVSSDPQHSRTGSPLFAWSGEVRRSFGIEVKAGVVHKGSVALVNR